MRLAGALVLIAVLTPAAGRAKEPPRHPERPWRIAMWSVAGAAATSLGLAIGFTARMQSFAQQKNDLLQGYAQRGAGWVSAGDTCAGAATAGARDVTSVCDSGRRWSIAANVMYGVTGGLVLFTGYLYYRGYIRGDPRVAVQPLAGPRVGGLSIGGTF